MKIITPPEDDRSKHIAEMKQKFELVNNLNLDSVVKYYEFCEDATWTKKSGEKIRCCFLVMELLRGVELLEFFNEMQEHNQQVMKFIFYEVARAIHQLHKHGIAHRDIKLDNVMITNDCKVKLIDLDYCRALSGTNNSGYM